MKINIRYIVLLIFLFFGGIVVAQQLPNSKRAIQAQAIEEEVQEFIVQNRANYELLPQRIETIRLNVSNSKYKGDKNVLLQQILLEAKDGELRELYFQKNPNTQNYYVTTSTPEIRYICDNGGLEDGYTDEYDFESAQITGVAYDCGIGDSALTPIVPSATVNDFNATVTLVDDDTTASGGFDPVLNGFSIEIPRINSGNTAIKLNSNNGSNKVTKMSKTFTVNSQIISFSYSFIANYRGVPSDASYFTAKLYKTSDNSLIEEFCIKADAANTAVFDNFTTPGRIDYVYTGWQCQTLSLEGAAFGTEVRLEFTVTDSLDPAYLGTVYIDDICDNGGECQARYGKLILDVNSIECEPLPIKVCGDYQLPFTTNTDPVITGTLDSLVLNIYESDGTTLVSTISTASTLTDTEFCFEVDDTDLTSPLQDYYEFEAVATYTIFGDTYSLSDFSTNLDFDLDFANCFDCSGGLDDLIITTDVASLSTDEQEANLTITASNTVEDGGTAIYHAGKEVLLIEDFESLQGSTGRYYIEGCTNNFVARPGLSQIADRAQYQPIIDLIEKFPLVEHSFKVYPNPAQNLLTITISNDVMPSKVNLYSVDGKLILQTKPSNSNSAYTIDISSVSKGIYILSVETTDGNITSTKVVKN